MLDLRAALPLESPFDALDLFLGRCLFEAGHWASFRSSDGIFSLRVLEHTADRLRAWGYIYEIDQSLHPFWLDLTRDPAGAARWTLHFEVDAASAQKARNALDSHDRAEDIAWDYRFTGTATLDDGALIPAADPPDDDLDG